MVLSCASCGDDGATSAVDAAVVDATPDAFACPMGTVQRTGVVTKYGSMGNGPFDGVRACVEGRPDSCVTSTAAGTISICVPASNDYALRLSHAGYETDIFLYAGAHAGQLTGEIGDDPFVTTLWADSGATFPPSTSGLLFVGLNDAAGALANATVTISPAATATISYGDASQVAHRNLTATSTSGTVYIGDLPPGSYDVTVTATPPVTCRNRSLAPMGGMETAGGFESTTAGAAVRAPVVAGVTTAVYLRCMQ